MLHLYFSTICPINLYVHVLWKYIRKAPSFGSLYKDIWYSTLKYLLLCSSFKNLNCLILPIKTQVPDAGVKKRGTEKVPSWFFFSSPTCQKESSAKKTPHTECPSLLFSMCLSIHPLGSLLLSMVLFSCCLLHLLTYGWLHLLLFKIFKHKVFELD